MDVYDFRHLYAMMRIPLAIFFCLFLIPKGFSQSIDSTVVVFIIEDVTHQERIPNVRIHLKQDEMEMDRVASQGIQYVKLKRGSEVSYELKHPLYESVNGSKKLRFDQDTIRLNLEMQALRVRDLKDVVVKPPGKPDTVFQSNRLSVEDFVLMKDGKMVLLTYPRKLKKGSEMLLFDGQQVLSSFDVPDVAERLVRDFRGNSHVVCENNVYAVMVTPSDVGIAPLSKEYFFNYVAPIVDTTTARVFVSNFNKDYPAFHYFAYDSVDSTYRKIVQIKDDLMMELYRSEYKWVDIRTKLWAKNKEYETGIDAEIWVGANYFTQSIYYKELYAPLFSRNDTCYVFDYYKDMLYHFDKYGNKLDSIPIYHHYHPKSTGWKKEVIQDRMTGRIYAVYDRDGYQFLGLIDTRTGEVTEQVKLSFRYATHIQVHDNFVYYVYRPFESAQKKFLYKERLPYHFGEASILQGNETIIETGK
jgi:hypothetical protein